MVLMLRRVGLLEGRHSASAWGDAGYTPGGAEDLVRLMLVMLVLRLGHELVGRPALLMLLMLRVHHQAHLVHGVLGSAVTPEKQFRKTCN